MKDKAVLQDQLDKYIDKEMEQRWSKKLEDMF
jgi:hypothetical protein